MENLSEVLKLHKAWINREKGVRADLSGANLSGADLIGADLRGANLSGANLIGADLRGANLSGANLIGADLSDADLRRANLSGANLSGADLSRANLSDADLRRANLIRANLIRANLIRANLIRANLIRADLRGADLIDAKNIPEYVLSVTSITPEGELIGWKKCRNGVLVKLLIPVNARRSNATGRKCRSEYAVVLEVFGAEYAVSQHDSKCIYRPGETVSCHNWDENRWSECAGGIHFFLTRYEAEQY